MIEEEETENVYGASHSELKRADDDGAKDLSHLELPGRLGRQTCINVSRGQVHIRYGPKDQLEEEMRS